jgi:acyl carrier protein
MIQQQIKTVVARQLGVVESILTDSTNVVDDLNADSLDLVELVIALERTFRIRIEQTEYEDAKTIQQITHLVQSKLGQLS